MDDFRKYAINNGGVSPSYLDDYQRMGSGIFAPKASMTPYILEERKMQVTQMDIFSRMMKDRIIWVAGEVNEQMATIVAAQLMYLDNESEGEDITLNISSPGGSVSAGLSMVATMEYIKSDIRTVNLSTAASMGSILLGAGTKGKRSALNYSRVMLHQVSAGYSGNVQDLKINYEETQKYNKILFDLLGGYTGKTSEQVMEDASRDLWLNPKEALEYGIIDNIITSKK